MKIFNVGIMNQQTQFTKNNKYIITMFNLASDFFKTTQVIIYICTLDILKTRV